MVRLKGIGKAHLSKSEGVLLKVHHDHRKTLQDPKKLVRELVPISQQNRVGILFGPEDRGLSNLELKYCHTLVTIPTAEFASLNLAQAVMVLAYGASGSRFDSQSHQGLSAPTF